MLLKNRPHPLSIGDVGPVKLIALPWGKIVQPRRLARIGQLVHDNDRAIRLTQEPPNQVGTNKAGTSCYQDGPAPAALRLDLHSK